MNEANSDQPLTMSSITGKLVLALIRGSDYAHAGEEEAIDLVLGPIGKESNQRLLDVGCGIGGTAHYVQSRGWGTVTGVDLDPDNIEAATQRHPGVAFVCSDAATLDQQVAGPFDVIYIFNAFFLFADQAASLRAMRRVAREGAKLALFDYVERDGDNAHGAADQSTGMRRALKLEELEHMLSSANWMLQECVPMHDEYFRWYDQLVARIVSMREKIIAISSEAFYEYVLTRYSLTREDVAQGRLGGATFYASAV